MQIKQSIFQRGKKGGDARDYDKAWTLRLIAIDDLGNRTSKTWQYSTKNDAKDDAAERKAELTAYVESKGLDLGDIKTFRQWAEFSKKNFYQDAVIVEGRKTAGVRSKSTHIFIDQLIACFGDKLLSKFTKYDLDRYKAWRFEQGDLRGESGKKDLKERSPVSISTVNRGLVVLRHLLKEAYDVGLIVKDVTKGSKAMDRDAETARTRTLTDDEERRLLASCKGTRTIEYKRKGTSVTAAVKLDNPYLKAVILLGLDAGMRRGEILKLEWQDIDTDAGVIKILGTHTKTQKTRTAPLTARTKAELLALPNAGASGKIFPFNDFKRSWATAVKVAKIDGLNFHDLRRTFVTRLQTGGISIGIAAELAGHSRIETTQKHYTSTDNTAIIQDAAARINAANDARLESWPDTIE